ncbi:MAG TPA: hypothetical protein VI282_01865, partial [Verrucomicrobiae bacterium]
TGGIEFYHSPKDTPENLSQRTLQHYGAGVLPLVVKLGNADDQTLANCLKPGDATFFTLCRGLFIRYSAALQQTFVILTTILFFIAIARARFHSLIKIKALLLSSAVTALAALRSAIIAFAVVYALKQIFHPRTFGPFIVGIPSSELFLLAIILATASLTRTSRLLRKISALDRLAGTILVWLLLALLTNFTLPGASYLFMWPAFFATIALHAKSRPQAILLTAAPAALLLAPTILLIHQTITIGIAPVSAALIALAISLEPLAPPQNQNVASKA